MIWKKRWPSVVDMTTGVWHMHGHLSSIQGRKEIHTCRALSIGTLSISLSYIFLFLNALLRQMRRKVWRSMAQRLPLETAFTLAARGMLYNSASSPKLPRLSYVCTCIGSPAGSFWTYALYVPLKKVLQWIQLINKMMRHLKSLK